MIIPKLRHLEEPKNSHQFVWLLKMHLSMGTSCIVVAFLVPLMFHLNSLLCKLLHHHLENLYKNFFS